MEYFPQSWIKVLCWIFRYSRNLGLNSVNIDPSKGWWSSDRSRKWDIVITLLPYSGGEAKDTDGDRDIGILKSVNNHFSILIRCQIQSHNFLDPSLLRYSREIRRQRWKSIPKDGKLEKPYLGAVKTTEDPEPLSKIDLSHFIKLFPRMTENISHAHLTVVIYSN